MEPVAPKPSGLDFHQPYGSLTPPSVRRIMPLRIVKRPESSCSTARDDVDERSPRTCSQETNESRGSAPEPPDGEQQLTVPKVRGSRSSRVFGSLDDVDESPVPLGRDPYLPKDFGGFRDRCFMSPRHVMSPPYRPFPGLLGDIIQRSKTSNNLALSDSGGPLYLPRKAHEECSIIVPEVRVTPETKIVDYGYHNLWVAIEIEGTGDCGTMYDVKVDVEATTHSNVLEIIKNYSAPSTLAPGSRLLVLANVELRLSSYSMLRGHVRSQSDELMEDLEHHLGSAQCEYLKISLIYGHTAFPSTAPAGPDCVNGNGPNHDTDGAGTGGVTASQTKIRTTFTASITRHNAASPWSPPPAPAPNRLAGIIAAHWGVDAADELVHTRLARNTTARRTTYLGSPGSVRINNSSITSNSNNNNSSRYHARPGFREFAAAAAAATTRTMTTVPGDENERSGWRGGGGVDRGEYGGGGAGYDPASMIWARLRRGSGLGGGAGGCGSGGGGDHYYYRGGAGSSKTSLTDMTNQQHQHQQHQHQHQHQQQAVGADGLDRKRLGAIRKVSGKSRRGSGRWGFGNWWA